MIKSCPWIGYISHRNVIKSIEIFKSFNELGVNGVNSRSLKKNPTKYDDSVNVKWIKNVANRIVLKDYLCNYFP